MAYTGLYRSHRIFCSKRVWGYIGSTGGRVWDYVEGVSMHGSVETVVSSIGILIFWLPP